MKEALEGALALVRKLKVAKKSMLDRIREGVCAADIQAKISGAIKDVKVCMNQLNFTLTAANAMSPALTTSFTMVEALADEVPPPSLESQAETHLAQAWNAIEMRAWDTAIQKTLAVIEELQVPREAKADAWFFHAIAQAGKESGSRLKSVINTRQNKVLNALRNAHTYGLKLKKNQDIDDLLEPGRPFYGYRNNAQ
jgi:hypothetical protein